MPDVNFWQNRFKDLGIHSVGPGDTNSEEELEAHRQIFLIGIEPYLPILNGPVLDFGCGVGRWVNDLPRPYLGLDLTPEHIEFCKQKYQSSPDIAFDTSDSLKKLPDNSFYSIFTVTVLQHITEKGSRDEILEQFNRLLKPQGTFLSVEWAEGQREFDWCISLKYEELRKYFKVEKKGEVVENGRKHAIWICSKKKKIFFFV